MSDQIWSRQFYKALEAVGKLTEVEKVRLTNILIAVNDVKKGSVFQSQLPDRNVEPLPLREVRGVGC